MENKILTPYIKEILESNDFSKGFSLLEKHAIGMKREGLFGIVKQDNSDNYLFTPKILLGSEVAVGFDEGINYSQNVLGEKWKNRSPHYLATCKDFQNDCLKKNIPTEIMLKKISKKNNWDITFKDAEYGFADNFSPLMDIHNHPNNLLIPSREDLYSGFLKSELAEWKFYSIITSKEEKGNFPFLIMSFYGLLDKDKTDEIESKHISLTKKIRNMEALFNSYKNNWVKKMVFDQLQKQNTLEGFNCNFFVYDLKERKVLK